MTSPYLVINASAGSGKTHSLIVRFLSLCLKSPQDEKTIGRILALTFTNKAANEMKQRILNWLKDFSSEKYVDDIKLADIKKYLKEEEGIEVSIDELHHRAKNLLSYLLHNYSTLNISTIDKFNSKLIRSFSYELGLAQNFNLDIDAKPYLIEAVDMTLDQIGENREISDSFLDFVTYNLEQDERVSLNKTLYKSAKEYINDKHYFELQKNKDFSWEAYEKLKTKLREEIATLREDSLKTIREVKTLLTDKNLKTEDFSGKSKGIVGAFFEKAQSYFQKISDKFPFPANETNAIENYMKGSSRDCQDRQADIMEIMEELLEQRIRLISNYVEIKKRGIILREILPLIVNKDIQEHLALIEEENDLVLLSQFNEMIHENLKNEPSEFIYEKVGTRFQHYFFDEFQDTSLLQWQNFIPLKDHAVSSENSSFTIVGDPKQSIYGFRGGSSKMMMEIINHKDNSLVPAKEILLSRNWRSAKNIVKFNNELYHSISKESEEEIREVFNNSEQQAQSAKEGRVRINLIENSTKEIFLEEVAQKMQEDLQACVDNGFSLSDITVLCRKNDEVLSYSQMLGNLTINYKGKEIYIKTISDNGLTLDLSSTVRAIIEYLQWKQNPENTIFFIKMLYFLNQSGRIVLEDFTKTSLEILKEGKEKGLEKVVEEKFGLRFSKDHINTLNLYNYIEFFVQEFAVENRETDYLLNFLELAFNFSQNAGLSLKDFLKYWEEEGKEVSILSSENIDAVQIMTIHKAKGLEFPVTFIPMTNSSQKDTTNLWFDLEEDELRTINIQRFTDDLVRYDEALADFNEKISLKRETENLCIQYVATTRAIEQLFFYLEKPNKTENYLKILDFLGRGDLKDKETPGLPDSYDLYPTTSEILQKQKNEEDKSIKIQAIKSIGKESLGKQSLRIATPSKNYQHRKEKVKRGIFIHEILSKITSKKDIPKVLKTYLMEGLISIEEKEQIYEEIQKIVNDPKTAVYFEEGVKSINERELMISEGGSHKNYRPDRLIETDEGLVILDFKTGERDEKHLKQIENYKNCLEKLGKKVRAMEIVYC